MQISVPVTFDATNQTMSVSDSSLITFPQNTSDFSIVTVNGMDCITPTTVSTARANYVTFVLANTITEIEFDSYITIPTASWNWNLWFALKVPGPTYYSLTYEPQGNWHNPDGLSCNLATGTWYTIKVTSTTVNIYNKSNGTLVHTRSLVGMPSELTIANFIGSTSYLANLVLKRTINTEQIRYANTSGIAEIWANVKNWVLAHIGNGTLHIRMGGVEYQFKANQGTDLVIEIPVLNNGYGISSYGLAPYGGYMEESEAAVTYNGVDEIGNALITENARIANADSVIEEDIDTGAGIGTVTTAESASTFDEV